MINLLIINSKETKAQQVIGDEQISYNFVDQICYKTIRKEQLRVYTELDVTTLTNMEKMRFQTKKLIQEHKEYFNEIGYYTHKIVYDTSINYFPKWYKVPRVAIFDSTGITNYYEGGSEYYNGGWPGGGRDSSYYGNYYTNIRTGEKTYVERYSENARLAYLEKNETVNNFGLLYGKVFNVPTNSNLNYYSSLGYTVEITATTITVYNSDIKVIWDLVTKSIIKIWYEDDIVVNKIIVKYTYNELLDVDIKTEIVEITPAEFDNGDCYEDVVITDFKGYTLCGNQLTLRDLHKNKAKQANELIISPNPVLDFVNIEFPEITEFGYLDLVTLTGKVIIRKELVKGQSYYKLDMSNMVSGAYIVKVKNSQKTFIKKFVKQ